MDKQLKREISQITQFLKDGMHKEALQALKAANADHPNTELVLGLLASQYAQLNMYDDAKNTYESLLAINSQNHLAHFQLGMLEYQSGKIEEAIAQWENVASQKDDFVANYWIAQAYFKEDRIQQAKPYISKSFEKVPSNHDLSEQIKNLYSLVQEVE